MPWISLPLAAMALASPAPSDTPRQERLPAEYRPCSGAVPVFNPEGCPSRLAVEKPAAPDESACRDRIALVRGATGQPQLEQQPASPERPYMIATVDKRIDGCAVMQMHRDIDDLRPLPVVPDGQAKVYRAR